MTEEEIKSAVEHIYGHVVQIVGEPTEYRRTVGVDWGFELPPGVRRGTTRSEYGIYRAEIQKQVRVAYISKKQFNLRSNPAGYVMNELDTKGFDLSRRIDSFEDFSTQSRVLHSQLIQHQGGQTR